jgi:drug/metabolite transporter (DMT)-like permease
MIAQSLLGAIALTVLTWISPEVPQGSSGFVLRGWVSTMGPALPWIFLQAVGSIFGIGLIIRAYQLGQASYVAVYEYSGFIFGPFFAWLLIGQQVWACGGGRFIAFRGPLRGRRAVRQMTLLLLRGGI